MKKKMMMGEITLEAAIVMPLVMALVLTVICFVLYVRDGIVLKTCAYGAANSEICESEEGFQHRVSEAVQKEHFFVLEPSVQIRKGLDSYKINVKGRMKMKLWGMGNLVESVFQPGSMPIEKNMSSEILYITRTVIKQVERK